MEAKYDTIGIHYNRTRKADPHLTSRLRYHLAPQKGNHYLDIGCGTGNYTSKLQNEGFTFTGIDPSEEMLEKAQLQNPNVQWKLGTAEQTGLATASIDGIMGSLTMHHWADLKQGFAELFRIAKKGSRIVLFTSTPQQMEGYWLNHYFPKMLADSMVQMPSYEAVATAMTQAGFTILGTEKYFIQPDLEDQFLYCGKHQPELYFDAQVRHGISSFSSLANREEVNKGMTQLRAAIDSGTIHQIIQSYENDGGDYLYIIGQVAD